MKSLQPVVALFCLCSASCVVPDGARPSVTYGLDVATQNNRRGVVLNERLVAQPSVAVALPAEKEGTIVARTWGNMDLSNANGDAWVPKGDRFGFSQLDWSLLYEQLLGDYLLVMGLNTYSLPKGGMLIRGTGTSELMVEGSTKLSDEYWNLQPRLAVHWDYDEIDGMYFQAGVSRDFPIDEKLSGELDLALGWMDDNQAYYTYGGIMANNWSKKSGFADCSLTGRLNYSISEHIEAHGFLTFSDVVTGRFRDNLDDVGIDASQVYLGAGVTWSY